MTYAVLLTPSAMGAIAVIEVGGPRAREVVASLAGGVGAGGVRRVQFVHAGKTIDDGLVVAAGADVFELHVHGGPAVIEAMFAAIEERGAKRILPGEMEIRSVEDELAAALPRAVTATAVRLLANQPEALRRWVREMAAEVDGGTWRVASQIQWVLDRARTLDRVIEPARVAIVGPPNAGKSTLANALLGRDVAITSDTPGTTRDWVDAGTIFVAERAGGTVEVPVVLVDTAGIRETPDAIEAESIRRTRDQLARADAAIVVVDGTRGVDGGVAESLPRGLPRVVAVNKCDVAGVKAPAGAVGISALRGGNLGGLMRAVMEGLGVAEVDVGEVYPFAARQRGILLEASLAADADHMKTLLKSACL